MRRGDEGAAIAARNVEDTTERVTHAHDITYNFFPYKTLRRCLSTDRDRDRVRVRGLCRQSRRQSRRDFHSRPAR